MLIGIKEGSLGIKNKGDKKVICRRYIAVSPTSKRDVSS